METNGETPSTERHGETPATERHGQSPSTERHGEPTSFENRRPCLPQTTCKKRRSGPRNGRQSSTHPRNRFNCPVPGCPGKTVNVQRHLHDVHKDKPKFEADGLVANSRKKAKRSYQRKRCTFVECRWTGTRPEKHLRSKVHNLSKPEALSLSKRCPIVDSALDMSVPINRSGMHTAESISEEFCDWYGSIEGGSYVPLSGDTRKKKKVESQNSRMKVMIKQVLQEYFKDDEFPIECLSCLKSLGRNNAGKPSVLEKLQEGKTWGSVKNYVIGLGHFLRFIEVCYPHVNLDILGLRAVFAGIMKTVNKFVAKELQKRKLRDKTRLVPRETMDKYLRKKSNQRMEVYRQNKPYNTTV